MRFIFTLWLFFLCANLFAEPNSYPALGITIYKTSNGQIAWDTGDSDQIFASPLMGLYGTQILPVAVTASGALVTTGGGGGGGGAITSPIGQMPMGASVSVVIASNQSNVPVSQGGTWTTGRTWDLNSGTDSVSVTQSTSPWVVSGSISISNFPASQSVNLTEISGSAPGATNSLPIQITNGSSFVDPTQIRTLTTSDEVTAFEGGTWTVAATQSGTWTTGRTWSLNSSTDSVGVTPQTASTSTITAVNTISGSSVSLLSTNTSRKGLILFNKSAGFACYIAFENTASASSFSFQLIQGGSYHMDNPTYQGSISAYCSTGVILVTEM